MEPTLGVVSSVRISFLGRGRCSVAMVAWRVPHVMWPVQRKPVVLHLVVDSAMFFLIGFRVCWSQIAYDRNASQIAFLLGIHGLQLNDGKFRRVFTG